MIPTNTRAQALLRIDGDTRSRLEHIAFRRYPDLEWGAFLMCSVRSTVEGPVVTIVDIVIPEDGDLATDVANVRFLEPYMVRTAFVARRRELCAGVVHSHPEGARPIPSWIDDEMDTYLSEYFSGFAPRAAYVSLIVSRSSEGVVTFGGRVLAGEEWYVLSDVITAGEREIRRDSSGPRSATASDDRFVSRLESVVGAGTKARLEASTVVVIGCSGTGSPTAHALARASVGTLVLVDPERFVASNLERMHGSGRSDDVPGELGRYKVEIVGDLVRGINPDARVIEMVGNILDPEVVDLAVRADLIICCTDSTHSRVAVSELSYRYLVPALDVGVLVEGANGRVTAEVAQFTQYAAGLPCAFCRALVDPWLLAVELMTEDERNARRREAQEARDRGEPGAPYWRDVPQLHTVGHLTSAGGAMVAGYAIGWLTGRFSMPAQHFQIDLLADMFGYVAVRQDPRPGCVCTRIVGYGDLGAADSVISRPSHFPAPIRLR